MNVLEDTTWCCVHGRVVKNSLHTLLYHQGHTCKEDLDHGLKILQNKANTKANEAFCEVYNCGKEFIILLPNKIHLEGRRSRRRRDRLLASAAICLRRVAVCSHRNWFVRSASCVI